MWRNQPKTIRVAYGIIVFATLLVCVLLANLQPASAATFGTTPTTNVTGDYLALVKNTIPDTSLIAFGLYYQQVTGADQFLVLAVPTSEGTTFYFSSSSSGSITVATGSVNRYVFRYDPNGNLVSENTTPVAAGSSVVSGFAYVNGLFGISGAASTAYDTTFPCSTPTFIDVLPIDSSCQPPLSTGGTSGGTSGDSITQAQLHTLLHDYSVKAAAFTVASLAAGSIVYALRWRHLR